MFKKYYITFSLSLGIFILLSTTKNSNNFNYSFPIESNYYISSYFGNREIFGSTSFHTGIDIAAYENTSVHSISSGFISYIGFDRYGYGNFIIVKHSNSYSSLYGHLTSVNKVKLGEYVTQNQIIGSIGPKVLSNGLSNGSTTGPHLHLTIYDNYNKLIDPIFLLK